MKGPRDLALVGLAAVLPLALVALGAGAGHRATGWWAAGVVAAVASLAAVWWLLRSRSAAMQRVQELEALRLEFRAMAETLPIAVYRMENGPSGHLRFTYVSRRVADILGVTADEIVADPGSRWRHAHPDDLDHIQAHMQRTVQAASSADGISSSSIELRCLREDGVRWVRSVAMRIATRADGVSIWSGYYEDVTGQHIDLDLLAQAKAEAEQAAQAKADFLANMSHEIRTPLNGILGAAHLLDESGLDRGQARRLRQIRDCGRHLLALVNDILDLSKSEAGEIHLEVKPFVLSELIDRMLDMVAGNAQAKGLALRVAVGPDVPPALSGDELRLGQVLLNYLGNAIKFTEAGSVTLSVDVLGCEGTAWVVEFAVTDTGIGLSQAQIQRLFRNFAQADTSTSRRYGGTGLGLSICKRWATLMGGCVGVQSEPGQGARFWLRVPLPAAVMAAEAAEPSPGAALPAAADANLPLAGLRLLLVEDNEINQELARELLTMAGCEVDAVFNGQEALDQAERQRYDLVLMDMQMPVMDGLQATTRLREMPAMAQLPIIAMTANVMARDRQRCLDAGMNDVIGKPLEPEQLVALVHAWCRGAKRLDASAPPSPAGPARAGSARRSAPQRGPDHLAEVAHLIHTQAASAVFVRFALNDGRFEEAGARLREVMAQAERVGAHTLRRQAESIDAALRRRAGPPVWLPLLASYAQTLDAWIRQAQAELRAGAAGIDVRAGTDT